MCEQFTSAAACEDAGCFPALGRVWLRDGSSGGTSGGEGGARSETCSVEEDVFLRCKDSGGGGAVALHGCDAECNSCTRGSNVLPPGWTFDEGCFWTCENGVVVPP
jgi:hypothetical protein